MPIEQNGTGNSNIDSLVNNVLVGSEKQFGMRLPSVTSDALALLPQYRDILNKHSQTEVPIRMLPEQRQELGAIYGALHTVSDIIGSDLQAQITPNESLFVLSKTIQTLKEHIAQCVSDTITTSSHGLFSDTVTNTSYTDDAYVFMQKAAEIHSAGTAIILSHEVQSAFMSLNMSHEPIPPELFLLNETVVAYMQTPKDPPLTGTPLELFGIIQPEIDSAGSINGDGSMPLEGMFGHKDSLAQFKALSLYPQLRAAFACARAIWEYDRLDTWQNTKLQQVKNHLLPLASSLRETISFTHQSAVSQNTPLDTTHNPYNLKTDYFDLGKLIYMTDAGYRAVAGIWRTDADAYRAMKYYYDNPIDLRIMLAYGSVFKQWNERRLWLLHGNDESYADHEGALAEHLQSSGQNWMLEDARLFTELARFTYLQTLEETDFAQWRSTEGIIIDTESPEVYKAQMRHYFDEYRSILEATWDTNRISQRYEDLSTLVNARVPDALSEAYLRIFFKYTAAYIAETIYKSDILGYRGANRTYQLLQTVLSNLGDSPNNAFGFVDTFAAKHIYPTAPEDETVAMTCAQVSYTIIHRFLELTRTLSPIDAAALLFAPESETEASAWREQCMRMKNQWNNFYEDARILHLLLT